MTDSTGAFVGRATEFEAVRRALREARAGAGSTVLVAGEPGVGKTRFVEESVRGHAGRVAWAVCAPDASAPPFWPWRQVLRSLSDEQTLGGVGRADESSRFLLFDAVTRQLAAAAADDPLVVVLDDLQWADEASLQLLQFVAREVSRLPLLLVATYRDTELEQGHPLLPALGDLVCAGQHLTLGGLATAELVHLVRSVAAPGARVDERTAQALQVQTGGNPFFTRELVRLLEAEGRLDAPLHGAHPVPGGVRAVVSRRLARLPQPTHDVLSWAALVGTTFDVALLCAVTGRSGPAVVEHLRPAVEARMVLPAQVGRWRFVHDLVRETLVSALGPADRAARHRALGSALAGSVGTDPDGVARVAAHVLAGTAGDDVDDAVRWAVRAAERAAAVLAHEDAASWYARAVELRRSAARGDPEEAALLLALGTARLEAGALAGARDAFVGAADLARARGDSAQLAAAALGLGAGFGGFEVALFDQVQIDLLEEALRTLPPGDTALRAWLLARLSVASAFVEGSEHRAALAEEAVVTARRAGDDFALAHALAGWCDAHSGPDDVERRLGAADEVVALARASGGRPLELLGRRLRVVALLERGRLVDAAEEVEAFSRAADALRQPLYRWYVPLWRATLAMTAGDLASATRCTDEAERLGLLAQSRNARVLVAVQRIVRLRHEGRPQEVADLLAQLLPDVPDIAAPSALAAALLLADVVRGDLGTARRRADQLVADGLRAPRDDSEWLPDLAQLADVAVALGHRELAAMVHEAMAPYARTFVVEGIGAAVCATGAHYLARTAAVLGRTAEASRSAALAAELHRAAGLSVPLPSLDALRTGRQDVVAPTSAALRREGDVWSLTYAGATVLLRDSKGLHDLAVLLHAPGSAVHVTELTGVPRTVTDVDLDRSAVAAYRRRLAELEDDLADAEADHDGARAERARAERDFLVDELRRALGRGGRSRRSGDPVERARKAVTARVRDTIARIGQVHPRLGRHLDNAVRTGTWCSYEPEQPVQWTRSPSGTARSVLAPPG